MITSPPYPNSRDYGAMFGPENALLTWFSDQGIINNFRPNRLIGSVCVSVDQNSTYEKTPAVRSKAAKKFLSEIENFSGPLRANYDNKIYYLPYFSNYFHGLENAYANIAKSLKYYSKGYIIVVNNTARNQVIPVSESVIDIWRSLGFKAEIVKELTRELFHVGSINPRARGFKSVHTEHTVRVWRE
jgi:hypothetical protein